MSQYDLIVSGGLAVLPQGAVYCDIGIRDGKITAISDDIPSEQAGERIDASRTVVFPGAVDAHLHLGIYRDLSADAISETRSALVTGSTTLISYFRTGNDYLNRTGPYREILPLVLEAVRGRIHTDVGFHLAPMTSGQVGEIEWLAREAGVSSFKYYFFYKGLNLTADSTDAAAYTLSDNYDFGHLYSIMEKVAEADARYGQQGRVSLSLHCENPELLRLFIERARELELPVLEKYSRARPPLAERLAIHEAGVLASATRVRINLLHISSREALLAANQIRSLYPELDIRVETTGAHLHLTYDQLIGLGTLGKVNPPVRTQGDVDALWDGIMSGAIQWVASDHGCCMQFLKGADLWAARPGLGASPGLYPVLLSDGFHQRGLTLERIADLASTAPAKAFGCYPTKGAIQIGADADLAMIDVDREQVVTPQMLQSDSDFSGFQGVTLKGWPVRTILRGRTVFKDGEVVGEPGGEFLRRPLSSSEIAAGV